MNFNTVRVSDLSVYRSSKIYDFNVFTARIRRMGKVMFSVCPPVGETDCTPDRDCLHWNTAKVLIRGLCTPGPGSFQNLWSQALSWVFTSPSQGGTEVDGWKVPPNQFSSLVYSPPTWTGVGYPTSQPG